MSLQAGYVVCDITPAIGCPMDGYGGRDRGSTGLEDPLQARVLALRSETGAVCFVCTDLLGVDEETADAIRRLGAEGTDLEAEQIMVCASHTHFGPCYRRRGYLPPHLAEAVSEEYRLNMINSISGAIEEAWGALQPARVGWSTGRADGITFNRRPVDDEGNTQMRLVLEPPAAVTASRAGAELARAWPKGGYGGPRLSPPVPQMENLHAGVTDAEVPLLRVDTVEGEPLATLISFACHAVVGRGDGYDISADYPGQARWAFERIVGGRMLFADGCAGDQVPTWRGGDSRERVGRALGAQAAKAWYEVPEVTDTAPIATLSRTVDIPVPEGYVTADEARRMLQEAGDDDSPEARQARSLLEKAEEVAGRGSIPRPIWAARVGDVGFVGLPGEVLVEIGLQIKQRSPFGITHVCSLTNSYVGYLCTDRAIKEGGYEPGRGTIMFNLNGPGTEAALVETALSMLQELYGGA